MSDEFVVVIGRFTPLGGPTNQWPKRNHQPKMTSNLLGDGTPTDCQFVKLERIVNTETEAQRAQKEFLALTDGL